MSRILDVAKEAGVSKSTVSRVINSNGPVGDKSRSKVELAMKKLNYTPNVFAQGMRTNKSRSIGILFPDLSNPFFADWYKTVEMITRKRGYMNYICITDEAGQTEVETIKEIIARNIDGLVFCSYQSNPEVMTFLKSINQTIPVVHTDAMDYHKEDAYIFADGRKGTYDAVIHLAKNGRKRIAYLKGEERFHVTSDRYDGYLHALADLGIAVNDQLIVTGDFHFESGYAAARKLMSLAQPPDAILAATDGMALGILSFLNKAGIDVPGEVAVWGFDNIAQSEGVNPSLSTVALPIVEMASKAINYLINKIEDPGTQPIQVVLDCQLIERSSSGKKL